ncbi:MAG: aminotransferase class I/II-fold pyridoxal phosphate-dependent enzyme [Clostridiales bacterium]|nr:aminotransferase class I/II-fold pyridoxal phosphate-dependent enzyme [Clostridiales bacterium]
MSYSLNRKIRDLKPYDPIEGEYRIRLDANESFLPVPEEIKTGILQAVEETAFHRYPDSLAKEVSAAFADYYEVDPKHVAVGNGSDESISVILSAFLMKGDKILTVSPDFSMYRFYASIVEAESVVLEKEEDLTISVDKLIKTANEQKVRMIIFSNPCNPTSLGLQRDEVRRLIRSVDALVVLDEAYMDFWDQSLLREAAQYENLIILRTCSKAFGMAAIRLGFSVANETLTNAIKAVKSPYNSNTLTQKIGAELFRHPTLLHQGIQEIVDSKQALYRNMKELEASCHEEILVYESCTNFIFIRTEKAKQIYDFLLIQSIAVRLFPGYLRISAGNAQENAAVVAACRQFLLEGEGKA